MLQYVMMALQAANAGLQLSGQEAERKSQNKYYKYLSRTASNNASLARIRGQQEIKGIGDEEQSQISRLHTKEREVIGSQKAALAAGAGVGSKTGEQLVKDTMDKVDMDEQAIRYNADLRMKSSLISSESSASQFEMEGMGYDAERASMNRKARWNTLSTILGSSSQIADTWNKYRQPTPTKPD